MSDDVFAGRSGPARWRRVYPRRRTALRLGVAAVVFVLGWPSIGCWR